MKLSRPFVALAALLVAAAPAKADPISLATWYTFDFAGSAGSFGTAGSLGCIGATPCTLVGNAPWTFASPTPVRVTIQDLQRSIDQFSLFDFGAFVGQTSAPGADTHCARDLDLCLLSPAHSRGVFDLGAGSHSLTIRVDLGTISGTSAFRVDRLAVAVPEPATLWLMAGGLAVLAGAAARRRRAAA